MDIDPTDVVVETSDKSNEGKHEGGDSQEQSVKLIIPSTTLTESDDADKEESCAKVPSVPDNDSAKEEVLGGGPSKKLKTDHVSNPVSSELAFEVQNDENVPREPRVPFTHHPLVQNIDNNPDTSVEAQVNPSVGNVTEVVADITEKADSYEGVDDNRSTHSLKEKDESKAEENTTNIDSPEKILAETDAASVYRNDFSKAPRQITGSWKEYETAGANNFLKGCKWAPDGTCILTNSDDGKLRLFNLPQELYSTQLKGVPEMAAVLNVKEPEIIYDYAWFPLMNSLDPATCCFASTSRDTPIHLWDAFTGELRCTYRAYDQADELTAAHSIAFSADGKKIYSGYNKMVRVFDVSKPGRSFKSRPTFVKEGQPGIISCIAVNPDQSGTYAAGSYARGIAVYSEPSGEMLYMFQGQQGGITHVAFSSDGTRLYSGGRKDPEILCWDLRNPGEILFTLQRKVNTNQRIYYDQDSTGQYMVSGNCDGDVHVWDTLATPETIEGQVDPIINPTLTFKPHRDMVNGVSMHPSMPILATASGQRNFPFSNGMSLEDSEGEEVDSEGEFETGDDNCLKLWWIGPENDN